jgi:serine/threonine-protein kinase
VVFFECLTGARPFRAPNLAALARQHQSSPPPVEEVPGPLRSLVERGLAKEPGERPESAETFLIELEAVAARAYGSDWEERGKRRLARLAGLLLVLFPGAVDAPVEAQTSLAETGFGEPEPVKLLSRLSTKIVIGTACTAMVIAVAVVLVKTTSGEPALQAGVTQVTPSTSPTVEALSEEPSETPEPTTKTTPEPSTSTSAAPTPPLSTPTPTRTRTPKPSKTPKPPKFTPKPVKTSAKTSPPAETPDPTITGDVDDPPTVIAPTTKPPATTAAATPRPTRTTTSPQPSAEPTPSPSTGGEVPRRTVSPQAAGLLAAGLMTSGAVPVTLAMKRHMAGRHRRKR